MNLLTDLLAIGCPIVWVLQGVQEECFCFQMDARTLSQTPFSQVKQSDCHFLVLLGRHFWPICYTNFWLLHCFCVFVRVMYHVLGFNKKFQQFEEIPRKGFYFKHYIATDTVTEEEKYELKEQEEFFVNEPVAMHFQHFIYFLLMGE